MRGWGTARARLPHRPPPRRHIPVPSCPSSSPSSSSSPWAGQVRTPESIGCGRAGPREELALGTGFQRILPRGKVGLLPAQALPPNLEEGSPPLSSRSFPAEGPAPGSGSLVPPSCPDAAPPLEEADRSPPAAPGSPPLDSQCPGPAFPFGS